MSEKRQTWHDLIASTYVVKTDEKGEVLLNGPATYEKKPLYTCLSFLVYLVLIALFVVGLMASIIFLRDYSPLDSSVPDTSSVMSDRVD